MRARTDTVKGRATEVFYHATLGQRQEFVWFAANEARYQINRWLHFGREIRIAGFAAVSIH
jgi:hypothetical protein